MSNFEELKAKEERLMCKTYARYPIAIKSGKNTKLYDFDGKEYTDLLSGIACTQLGHANEELADAMNEQARKLIHVSNLFYQEEQLDFAQKLIDRSRHLKKAFFCNSGAEANEALIKIARRYSHKIRKSEAFEIITLKQAFHGRTLAALAATGQEKYLEGFEPTTPGFVQVEYGDVKYIAQAINEKTCAVLVEVIQGEGGVQTLGMQYLKSIEALCRENNLLFLIDEVQTGFYRTGKFWAHQHFNLEPDAISAAKSLANGLPLGAMLCTEKVAEAFDYGSHATTFGGNAFCTAVASKAIDIIERDNLEERTYLIGDALRERFSIINEKIPNIIKEVRGLGLMIGIELNLPAASCKEVWQKLIDAGFILNLAQEKTLRLLPALTISEDELNDFAFTLEKILKSYSL